MKAKEMLDEYVKIKRKIRRYEEKCEQLRTLAESCTVDPTREKIQTSRKPDRMGDIVAKIADTEAQIEQERQEAADILYTLGDYMAEMESDKEWQVLILRYVKDASWIEIADTIGVSTRYVFTIHNRALKDLQEIMDAEGFEAEAM